MKKIILILSLVTCHLSLFGQEKYSYQYGGPGNGSLKIEFSGQTFDNDAFILDVCWYDPTLVINYYYNPQYYKALKNRVLETPYSKLGGAVNHIRTIYLRDYPAGIFTINLHYTTDDIDYWRTLGTHAWNVEVVNENNKYICINNIPENE